MRELSVLIAPVFWSFKNDFLRFNRSFYKRLFFYIVSSCVFIFLMTTLLNFGMAKLHRLSPEVFGFLLRKGYALVLMVIFFIQIINGIVVSLNTFYQSKELEVLLTSPVNRASLFFSRLIETHIKTSWMLIIFGLPLLISLGMLFSTDVLFYAYALVLFIAFSAIPVNIGIGLTMLFSSFFHVRRIKRFLLSGGIVLAIALVFLLRIFRPERFVNPELFANLTLFITEMKTPSFILLPNRWLSDSIFGFLNKSFDINTLIFISLLFLTSYVTVIILSVVFRSVHYRGWVLLQEGGIVHVKDGRLRGVRTEMTPKMMEDSGKVLSFVKNLIDTQSRALLKKDLCYQIKDEKNIHQLLILIALIVIYLFSISALPVNWEYYALQLKYVISFFNLGLILIILASLCSRLGYPAVVSEGSTLWIIKSSPLAPRRYIRTKFVFFFVPIFVVGQLLTVTSSLLIGIGKAFILLKIITVTALSLSLVGLAMTFGISGLKRISNDASQEKVGTDNTAYMLVSVFLVFLTLALEIIPVFLYFLKETQKTLFTPKAWLIIGTALFLVLLINLGVTFLAIRQSVKKIENLQL